MPFFFLYKDQLPEQTVDQISRQALRVLFFLVAGSFALRFLPSLAILVYLLFAVYLAVESYELFRTNYNLDLLYVAFAISGVFLLPIWGLVHWAPFVTSQLSFFFVSVGWLALSTFVGTLGALNFKVKSGLLSTLNAAFQSWAINFAVQYSFLYGRGDMDLIYRVFSAQHQFPIGFILLPFLSLCFSYLFTLLPMWLGIIDSESGSSKKKFPQKLKSKNN